MHFNAKPLVFVTNDKGCQIPITHKFNVDGYFRKRWGNELEMFHRFIYRAHNGEIPQGYEVDHMCGCRSCSNPKHLRAIEGLEHTVHTNRTRYSARKSEALKFWLDSGCTGTALAKKFGVSVSTGCDWINYWKAEAFEERLAA